MSPPFDVEQQLRVHGRALRVLAGELLRDGHAADDAVQDVWTQALRARPPHTASLGGWLRTVLVRVVSRLRRRDRRRVEREATAAAQRDPVSEDHTTVQAREEIVQRLMAAVHALGPLHREVIWERFFAARTPRQIAAARGEPIATVKSRLQRALAGLRERLGHDASGERDWRGAIVAAFGLRESAVVSAAWGCGGVLMVSWWKAVVVLGAVTMAAVWWWPRDDAPAVAVAVGTHRGAVPFASNALESAVASTTPAPSPGREAAPPAPPSANQHASMLRGRCVDEAGRPVAGCVVTLRGTPRSDDALATAVRQQADATWRDPAPVATRADGVFAIDMNPPSPLRLSLGIEALGMAPLRASWRSIEVGQDIEVGDVVLRPGIRLRLRVVDADGSPCPDAKWRIESQAGGNDTEGVVAPVTLLTGSCGADGTCVAPTMLVEGRYRANATEGGRQSESQSLLLVREQPLADVNLQFHGPRPPTIKGRIVDATGQPVPAARLHFATGKIERARRDGGFTLHRSPEDTSEASPLHVEAAGFAPLDTATSVAWGSEDVELRLSRRRGLVLSVRDAQGTAVLDYTVRCVPGEGTGQRLRGSEDRRVRARGPFDDGVAAIDGVAGGVWQIVLEFPASTGLPIWVDEIAVPPEGGRFDVHVQSCRRSVRVITRAGEPVAGTQVQLIEEPAPGARPAPIRVLADIGQWLSSIGPGHARLVEERTTDTSGRCEVHGRAGRLFTVCVLGPGHAPIAVPSVNLEDANDLVVEVARGGRLIGRITPGDALAQLARYYVSEGEGGARGIWGRPTLRLEPLDGQRAFLTWRAGGEVDAPQVAIAADGAYEFDGQPAGRWRIVAEYMRSHGRGSAIGDRVELGDVALVDGETLHRDVDLSWLLPGRLAAEVFWNGARFANATVFLDCIHRHADGTAQIYSRNRQETDASGAFQRDVRPGTFWVTLCADAEGHSLPPLCCPVPATVVAGRTLSQVFEFVTGKVELKVVDAAGRPVEGVVVFVGDERHSFPATDAAGRTSGEAVVGNWKLRALPGDFAATVLQRRGIRIGPAEVDPFADKWIDLGTVVVTREETVRRELHLQSALTK